MDGAGRAWRKASDHPDGVSGNFSGQLTVFDKAGQTQDSSNVAKINGSWTPVGESFLWTNLTRDELSRLKIVTHPDNNTKHYDYTGCGCGGNSETRITDELSHYTVTKTDFLGRLMEASEPLYSNPALAYSKAVYVYNELDQLTQIQHSNSSGNTQYRYFSYDGYARLSSENTPEGGTVNYTYTANDLVATANNQRNITVTSSYNTRNLATSVSFSDGTPSASYVYDEYGARTQMNDGEGATNYSYNGYRQMSSENRTFNGLSGKNYTLNYAYNQGDQLKSVNYNVSIPGGSGGGAPFSETDNNGGILDLYTVSGTVRDAQSLPVSGVTITLSGSQSGQVTTNSSGQYSFANLGVGGNYTFTPSKSGFVFTPSSRTYNNLNYNKPTADFTITPLQQTLFDKTINYAYNTTGALSSVGTNLIGGDPNANANVMSGLTFRASGAIKTANYGNAYRLTMGYSDQRQQPISMKVEHTTSGAKIIDYAYEYYTQSGLNDGRIRKITDNTNSSYTTNYYYDDYNRLMNAANGVYSGFYQYDPWGNIKTLDQTTFNYALTSGAPTTNRILSTVSGGVTYNHAYDAAGNMTNDGVQGYTYDGANRLKEVGTGGTNTYGYDGDGARVRQTSGGTPLFYVRSTMLNNVAMEVSQAQTVVRAYVYAGNKTVALQSKDGQFYWAHTDHLGSSRAMTDVNGNLTYSARMAPYGKLLQEYSATGDANLNSRKFTGYERDASGLDYANARMYASERGRFLQPDPLGLSASSSTEPESLNRYTYVRNVPVNYIDPSGFCIVVIFDSESKGYRWVEEYLCNDQTREGRSKAGPEGKGGGGRGPRTSLPDCAKNFFKNLLTVRSLWSEILKIGQELLVELFIKSKQAQDSFLRLRQWTEVSDE